MSPFGMLLLSHVAAKSSAIQYPEVEAKSCSAAVCYHTVGCAIFYAKYGKGPDRFRTIQVRPKNPLPLLPAGCRCGKPTAPWRSPAGMIGGGRAPILT